MTLKAMKLDEVIQEVVFIDKRKGLERELVR